MAKDPSRWFLRGAEAEVYPGYSVADYDGNDVAYFIDYRPAYAAIAEEIEAASGSDSFIYMAGWDLAVNVVVDAKAGPVPLSKLLTEASRIRRVPIRSMVMFNNGFLPPVNNAPTTRAINALPTGGAILDSRYLLVGTHHQKFVVIKNTRGLVGFCGGMDIAHFRLGWDDPGNPAPTAQDGPPWHDVHCPVRGGCAVDLLETFCKRWNDHFGTIFIPNATNRSVTKERLSLIQGSGSQTGGVRAQVVRTYGNGDSHEGLLIPVIDPLLPSTSLLFLGTPPLARKKYNFAPQGEQTIYKLLVKAIGQTQKYIYIEDQYLVESEDMHVGRAICKVLADKLADRGFEQLLMFA